MRTKLIILLLLNMLCTYAQSNIDYLIKAADRGDINAQRYLVGCYLTGNKGFSQNFSEAYRWMVMVAEQGDSVAQYELATNDKLKNFV